MPADPLAVRLAAVVGDSHVICDADLLASYETDWTRRYHGSARLVVRPGSTSEVAAVLRICTDAGAAIVAQGGNTGLVGGGVPRDGEIVLSLQRLTRIEPVDSIAGEVTVGAGVTLADLQQAALQSGFWFGVDIASRASATIGGMIATNAGGIRVLRYGPMRRQLLGIEAVLADGTVVSRMPGLSKDNTGYDLPGLLAGSEGTLAVITRAHLKLIPRLTACATALLAFDSVDAALAALRYIRPIGSLEAVEIFFSEGVELVTRHTGLPLPFDQPFPAYLLVECAAGQDPLPDLTAALESVTFLDSAVATDRQQRDRLWAYRERHTEAINADGVPHKLDVALPLQEITRFVPGIRERLEQAVPEARPILFGHVADGNIHVNVLGLAAHDDRATDIILRYVAELGGSISAEHGVGIAKTPWLHLTRTPEDIAAMQAIKAAFDPLNVLNPGVIFPLANQ
ncbi:MAG: FAD-binding oxidoreductase [Dehalococcoidia bacterium]|nr:FAD-binding oxidoreductase [Dehalococcoidia bacterium]